jgi:aminoglycoside phosphotransferase (APT) family kinase protein
VLDPTIAAAVGGAIGGWHAATTSSVHRARPAAVSIPAPANVHDPLLRAALAAAALAWRPTTVVHGDCGARNATVAASPSCGVPSVILTGWGRSGAGDPGWDLGCLVADLVGPGRRDPNHGATTATLVEPSVAAAVVAYGRAAGPVDLDLPRRASLFAVARLVATALDEDRREGLVVARSIATSIDRWTARIDGWLR